MELLFKDPSWIKRRHTIVKYKPEYYVCKPNICVNKVYNRDEWISISDIGKMFPDGLLTEAEYIKTENSYLSSLKDICNSMGVDSAIISYYEIQKDIYEYNDNNIISQATKDETRELHAKALKFKKGSNVSAFDIIELTKLALREGVYFQIYNPDLNFGVEVGYDYYMYVYTDMDIISLKTIVSKNGLYVDPR